MVLIQYFLDNYGNVLYTTTSLVTMVDHDKKFMTIIITGLVFCVLK
jgi:hypothetical protein